MQGIPVIIIADACLVEHVHGNIWMSLLFMLLNLPIKWMNGYLPGEMGERLLIRIGQ